MTLTPVAAFATTDAMRRCLAGLVAVAATLFNANAEAGAPRELVVAIRYLQAEGTSHAHLYLYREDGKLLRQLTNDNSGQDFDPIFAPDGATIVFSREKSAGLVEVWTVDPRGQGAKLLERAPEWYSQTRTSPYFANFDEPEPEQDGERSSQPATAPADDRNPDPPHTYRAPDGSAEVVVQRLSNDDDDAVDGEGTGKHFLLRDAKSGSETEMGTLPGFLGLWDVLRLKGEREHVYLFEGALRVMFFGLHLNSTDGDTVFALDLNAHRLVRLSPNSAAPIPLPGQPAFLTMTYVRYVPIPASKKTANCSYLERWDEKLGKVRFAREGTAALCYGASMYRPGDTPAVITLRRDGE